MTILDDAPTTVTAAPPPPPLRDRGALAPWRLAARLARRETRRRPGRTVLAALLIAIPVAAMTVGSVLVRTEAAGDTWDSWFASTFGSADVAVSPNLAGTSPSVDPIEPPAGTRTLDYIWMPGVISVVGPLSAESWVTWTDMPIDDPMVAATVDVIAGRAPEAGELLIGPGLANDWRVEVGDTVELGRPSGTWTIVGIGRLRSDYWSQLVIAPGFDRGRIADIEASLNVLYDLPDTSDTGEIDGFARRVGGASRPVEQWPAQPQTASLAWGWVGGALALVATGIIVAAAFATSARRQLVTVGQLASNGATPAVIRRTLALQGTWTAAAGAAAGITLGLGSLPFIRGPIETHVASQDLPGFRISWFDLTAIAFTALVAGTLAAAVPARSLASVPVMAALAGRRPLGAPPRWLVPTGLALFVGGLALLGLGGLGATNAMETGGGTAVWALVIIVAAVTVVFGMICATPLVVAWAGRLARVAPLPTRLALRSMARARTRSSAVVAAIAVAVGGSLAAAVVADAALADAVGVGEAPTMPADAVVIQRFDDLGTCCEGEADPNALRSATLTDDELAAIESILPGASVEPLLVASFDPPAFDWNSAEQYWATGDGPMIATSAAVDLVGLSGADRAALRADGAITGRDPNMVYDEFAESDGLTTHTFGTETGAIDVVAPVSADLPAYTYIRGAPLIGVEYADRLGFTPVQRGVIVRATARLTKEQRDDLDALLTVAPAEGDGGFVEPGDEPRPAVSEPESNAYWSVAYDRPLERPDERDLWMARAIILAAAVLVSSLVIAIGLALSAAEGRDERDVLTVVGAAPSTMRRQTTARAVVLAIAGIVLGIPTGYLSIRALWMGGDSSTSGAPFPWLVAGALVVVLPLVVAGTACLASAITQRARGVSITHHD